MISSNNVGGASGTSSSNSFYWNTELQTPLAIAIINNNIHDVKELLTKDLIKSTFIHGCHKDSLVCTLPLTAQPESNCFLHPPPLTDINPDIISLLDNSLVDYLNDLDKIEKEANRVKLQQEQFKKSANAVPFNYFGADIKVCYILFYFLQIIVSVLILDW